MHTQLPQNNEEQNATMQRTKEQSTATQSKAKRSTWWVATETNRAQCKARQTAKTNHAQQQQQGNEKQNHVKWKMDYLKLCYRASDNQLSFRTRACRPPSWPSEEEEEEEEEERPVRVDNSRENFRWKRIIVDNSRAMRAPFAFPNSASSSMQSIDW